MKFGSNRRDIAAVIAVSVMCAGCATAPTVENAGAPPTNYKEVARDYLRTALFDPYSARDMQIAPPKTGQVYIEGTFQHANGWAVCYRTNAKNRMGAYTGLKEAVLLIRDGKVVTSNEDTGHYDIRTNCADAKYEPISLVDGR